MCTTSTVIISQVAFTNMPEISSDGFSAECMLLTVDGKERAFCDLTFLKENDLLRKTGVISLVNNTISAEVVEERTCRTASLRSFLVRTFTKEDLRIEGDCSKRQAPDLLLRPRHEVNCMQLGAPRLTFQPSADAVLLIMAFLTIDRFLDPLNGE